MRDVFARCQKEKTVRSDLNAIDLAWMTVALAISTGLLGDLKLTGADAAGQAKKLRSFMRKLIKV